MKRVPLPGPTSGRGAGSSLPTAGPYSSMRSAICRRTAGQALTGPAGGNLRALGSANPSIRTSGSLQQPIRTSVRRLEGAPSGRTSITASKSFHSCAPLAGAERRHRAAHPTLHRVFFEEARQERGLAVARGTEEACVVSLAGECERAATCCREGRYPLPRKQDTFLGNR